MQILLRISCVFLIIFTLSCKKLETPILTEETPDFFVSLQIESEGEKMISAGVDDYYMYTDLLGGFPRLFTFYGELKKLNCEEDCPKSFKISLKNDELSSGVLEDTIGSFPVNQEIFYLDETENALQDTSYHTRFFPADIDAETNLELSWLVDGFELPGDTVGNIRYSYADFDVCLFVMDSTEVCSSSICKKISVNAETQLCNARMVIAELLPGQDSLQLTVEANEGYQDYSTNWISPIQSTSETIGINSGGVYEVEISDNQTGCNTKVIANISGDLTTEAEVLLCHPDFTAETTKSSFPAILPKIGKIEIEYINEEGQIFSSSNIQQNEANFRFLRLEDYENNLNREPTVILDFEFNCILATEAGETIVVTNGQGKIGMAYPR